MNLLTKFRVLRVVLHSGILLFLAAASSGPIFATPAGPAPCSTLGSLALPNTTITQTRLIGAGEFALTPDEHSQDSVKSGFKDLPAFCRVAATLHPSSDSDIKIEVWMPASGWIGKFQAVGNGGWAGAISYGAMSQALKEGYATASTDTGQRQSRHVRTRASRKNHRFRLPRGPRDDGASQVDHRIVLRQGSTHLLLERLLYRGTARTQGSAALSRRIMTG